MGFTASDVYMFIMSISRDKSPDEDWIRIEHLKYTGPQLPRVVAIFYDLYIGHSCLSAESMKLLMLRRRQK